MSDSFRGPSTIQHIEIPGRGRSYWMDFEGRKVEISVSPKGKSFRVYVDGLQWLPVSDELVIDGVTYLRKEKS